jgi:hypothetical protein
MRTITLSAEDALIEAAEKRARAENTTLDEAFQKWLAEYSGSEARVKAAMEVIEELRKYVRSDGRKFTREEMNERR